MTIEPVGEVVAGLGEGPRWDPATATLCWVDIPGGAIHRTDPATGRTSTIHRGPPVSLALPGANGRLLVAERHHVLSLAADGTARPVAEIVAGPAIRFNDGALDPAGRLWIGTMHEDREPAAALYRLDGDALTPVLDGVAISNGLGWSPDGCTFYYADTPTLRVDAFDYDPATARLANRRVFCDLAATGGRPDGLTVDAAGRVWIAMIAGGEVRCHAPDGRLELVVPLPVSHPTSCAFGGPDGTDLFVTTASAPLAPAELARQPLAGRLLRVREW